MPKLIDMPTNLSQKEYDEFVKTCSEQGVLPAKKVGELIHGFLVAEGVKHREAAASSAA